MYYIYVLSGSQTGVFYKGQTNNLERRLKEHFEGKSQVTRKTLPLQLIHVEICDTRSEARSMELFLKSGYGREIIKEIASQRADVVKW